VPNLTFRSMNDATSAMLRVYWGRTGVQPDAEQGSVLRTLFEAFGYEIEQQSVRFDTALREAIPEAVYAAFGFERQPAVAASVTLTFGRATPAPEPYLIPEGTVVETAAGVRFVTTVDATILVGATTVNAVALAEVPGSSGNVPAAGITRLTTLLPGVESVTNALAAFGGRDEESDAAQEERFAGYLASLAKGTAPALAAAALTVETDDSERAQQVLVVDAYDDALIPVGEARVYAYRPGGTSLELRDAILTNLELTQRPVGVTLAVLDVTPVTVTLTVTVHSESAEALVNAQKAVQTYFDSIGIGEDVYAGRIEARVVASDARIYRAVATITGGSPVVIGAYERSELGALTLTLDSATVV